MRDESKANSSKPNKPERKFVEVNNTYKTIVKEVIWDVPGTPLVMRTDNLEKIRGSNKWYILHEDFGNLVEDYISFKVQDDNYMQRGEFSKYRKEPFPSIVVLTPALWQTKYINVVFVRADVVTKGRRIKNIKQKRKRWKWWTRSISLYSETGWTWKP